MAYLAIKGLRGLFSASRPVLCFRAEGILFANGRSATRLIYDDSYLKIDQFINQSQAAVLTSIGQRDKLVDKVQSSVKSSRIDFSEDDLIKLILTTYKSRDDYTPILDAIKLCLKLKTPETKIDVQNIGFNLMKLLYVHNETDTAVNLYNDRELGPAFARGFTTLLLMNKLVIENRFEEVVAMFERNLPSFSTETSNSARKTYTHVATIPHDQTALLTESLMKMNSKKAFEKAVQLLGKFREKNAQLDNLSASRIFMLAFQQKEFEFLLRFLGGEVVNINLDQGLSLNLSLMAFAGSGSVRDALDMAKHIFKIRHDLKNPTLFKGRIFKMALNYLERAVSPNDQQSKSILENMKKKFKEEKRIMAYDFPEYCGLRNKRAL